jgi:hypothetical protein
MFPEKHAWSYRRERETRKETNVPRRSSVVEERGREGRGRDAPRRTCAVMQKRGGDREQDVMFPKEHACSS